MPKQRGGAIRFDNPNPQPDLRIVKKGSIPPPLPLEAHTVVNPEDLAAFERAQEAEIEKHFGPKPKSLDTEQVDMLAKARERAQMNFEIEARAREKEERMRREEADRAEVARLQQTLDDLSFDTPSAPQPETPQQQIPPKAELRGIPIQNLKEVRQKPDFKRLDLDLEQKKASERALDNQKRIQDMEKKLARSFENAKPFITPLERAELIPLQEQLIQAQNINDADIYQNVLAKIQIKLERYKNENPVTEFTKPLDTSQPKPNIILTNPKPSPGLFSKIKSFLGFGKK